MKNKNLFHDLGGHLVVNLLMMSGNEIALLYIASHLYDELFEIFVIYFWISEAMDHSQS